MVTPNSKLRVAKNAADLSHTALCCVAPDPRHTHTQTHAARKDRALYLPESLHPVEINWFDKKNIMATAAVMSPASLPPVSVSLLECDELQKVICGACGSRERIIIILMSASHWHRVTLPKQKFDLLSFCFFVLFCFRLSQTKGKPKSRKK